MAPNAASSTATAAGCDHCGALNRLRAPGSGRRRFSLERTCMTQYPASRHNARDLQAGHPADNETNNDTALLDRREIRGQKLRCAAAQALSSLDCAYSRSDGKLLIVGQTVGQ